jgi:AP-1 complex subunit gamma-1
MGDEVSPGGAATIPGQANGDILQQSINDILGLFDTSSSTPVAAPPAASPFDVLGGAPAPTLFASTSTSPPAPRAAPAQKSPGYIAYNKNSLKITLHPQVSAQRPGVVLITARFEVSGVQPAEGVNFQAAVPKVGCYHPVRDILITFLYQTQQMQMQPMSKADVQPGATETQALKIIAPPGVSGSIVPTQEGSAYDF